jgi:hypothetical protein
MRREIASKLRRAASVLRTGSCFGHRLPCWLADRALIALIVVSCIVGLAGPFRCLWLAWSA